MLPLGISFLVLFLSLRKQSRVSIISVLIFLWTFSIGSISQLLWKWIEHPWERIAEEQASTADVIVVLSSNERHIVPGKAQILEWRDPDRFFAGIKLFQEEKAPKLFFTGGTSPYKNNIQTQGDLFKKEAINLGIPSNAISTTGAVLNTREEAIAIRKSLVEKNLQTEILLVTSAFHMKRAQRQFERQGFIVHPFPVDFKSGNVSKHWTWKNPYNWMPNAGSLSKSSVALRELIGRIIYRSW